MLALERRRRNDAILRIVQVVTATAVVLFGAVVKADASRWGPLRVVIEWMQGVGWIVVVIGPVAVAVLQWLRKKFGNPWAWEAVQKVLDEFRNDLFGGIDDPLDHHRVTLFKYYKTYLGRNWPWTQWLIAVARSDHLTKLRIRRFRAPDDAERCRGVVGHAWRCKTWVIVPRLGTILPALTSTSSRSEILAYARETWVEESWVKSQLLRGRPLAASYAALPVQLKGKPWGVLGSV